jgi:hypothetical protein
MKKQIVLITTILAFALVNLSYAQDAGNFSGSLELNGNFFIRDSTTSDTTSSLSIPPQTQNDFFGGEVWLNMNYNYKGFDFGLRFDAFYNSNLPNPTGSYTAQGIGYWHIRKKIHGLDITAGHFYDQIGSGIIYRSYETRPLFIDNALVGIRLNYDLIDKDAGSLNVKAFMGRHKKPFADDQNNIISRTLRPVVKGLVFDGYWSNEGEGVNVSIAPGAGIVSRTLDEGTMNLLVSNILLDTNNLFVPKYNVYAATVYNTLSVGNFTGYGEVAYKTKEAVNNPNDTLEWLNKDGHMAYGSLAYSQKGFGVTLEAKVTDHFTVRSEPTQDLNLQTQEGFLHFLPPMTRINTYRLTSRYNAATQEFGELAFQADIRYSPKKTLTLNLFGSLINDLDNTNLFRELQFNVKYRKPKKYSMTAGVQYIEYNQEKYENKPGVPVVQVLTPYVDFLYKFDKKRSLRAEIQYLYTEEDLGQFAFALLEYSVAPHWIITASDMINVKPKKSDEVVHYPRLAVAYVNKSNRFSIAFVRQVAGIVCSGGICRPEPAFTGVKLGVTSSF